MTSTLATGATAIGAALPVMTLRQALADVAPAAATGAVLLTDGAITASDGELEVTTRLEWRGPPVRIAHAALAQVLEHCDDPRAVVTLTLEGCACLVAVTGEPAQRIPAAEPRGCAAGLPPRPRLRPLCRIPCDQFFRAVRATAGLEPSRESVVLIEVTGDECFFVAGDQRRLSCVRIEHDQAVDDSSAVVPSRALAAAAAVALRHPEDAVQLEAGERRFVASLPGATVSARLAQVAFPDWRQNVLSPRKNPLRIVVARVRLLAAARAAASRAPSADFEVSAAGIALAGRLVPALHAAGPAGPVRVHLDPRAVAGWLGCLTSEDDPHVSVEVLDATSPAVLRCDDDDYTTVVMPVAREGGGDGGGKNRTVRQEDQGRGEVFPALARPEPAGKRHRGALPGDARDGAVDGAPPGARAPGARAQTRARGAGADPRGDPHPRRRGAGQVERRRP